MKAVSLVDRLLWTDGDGVVHDEDDAKGQEFDLPTGEFERLEAAGAVAQPRSKDAKAAAEAVEEES